MSQPYYYDGSLKFTVLTISKTSCMSINVHTSIPLYTVVNRLAVVISCNAFYLGYTCTS